MSVLELVPIGTILGLLVDQVISTTIALNDVLIEKECFKTLSGYLLDISPILVEMQNHELNDTPSVRQTLDFLKEDCEKAEGLVQKYKNRGKFYTILFCRRIANEMQDATRAIGRSLAMLPLTNTKVLSAISVKVFRLQEEMQNVEYVASQSSLAILEKLDICIREGRHDQDFRNSMLEQIASFAGVPIESSEIKKELDSLRMEKEEAAARKEKQAEIFLKQVIELLSNGDDAHTEEHIRKQYGLISNLVEKSIIHNGMIKEYNASLCPITGSVMVDPVILCNGTTYEREAIEAWFLQGNTTDPHTGEALEDLALKPNISVRQLIQQWRDKNHLLKIRQAKEILQSINNYAYDDALCDIQKVVKENMDTKIWIAIEGLIDIIVLLLGISDGNLKSRSFQALLDIVERHSDNKSKAVEAGVLQHIVECVGLDSSVCTAAFNLLLELLQENDRQFLAIPEEDCKWNETLCRKLKQQHGAITFLVVIISDKQFSESLEKVEDILFQLCFNDDDMILSLASNRWYKPLVQRLFDGSDSTKHRMMRGLLGLQLFDEDLKQLGEAELINPLIKLAMTDDESKELAFSVMAKLSDSIEIRKYIVAMGGFSIILEQIFSSRVSPIIRENCYEIFEKITSGMEFVIDSDIAVPNQELMITQLLSMLQSPSTPIGIRKPAFRALLSISSSAQFAAEMAVAMPNGVLNILPLLEDSDKEIRELTLQLVHRFSLNVPVGITDFLLNDRRLEEFMSFLKDDSQPESQILAVSLLFNLQNNNNQLIKRLAKFGTIPLLLNMLRRRTMDANNNVLDLLSGFTNPADIEMQKSVVNFGAYPLLVDILKSGSYTAKARAAALISNLSSNSPKLTKARDRTACCHFWSNDPVCEVHRGICSLESSFCLLESGALPPLVQLLKERNDAVKLPAVMVLKTLVQERIGWKGANVLHRFGAIAPMLNLLSQGNSALKEEVLEILERMFDVREVVDIYGGQARNSLIKLSAYHTQNADEHLRGKAANLLSKLALFSQSGSMPS